MANCKKTNVIRRFSIVRLLYPIYDFGGLITLISLGVLLCVFLFLLDTELTIYLIVGSYVGIVVVSFLSELEPGLLLLNRIPLGLIEKFLDNEPMLVRLSGYNWGIKGCDPLLWSSNIISVEELVNDKIVLTGRVRDLKIIEAHFVQT